MTPPPPPISALKLVLSGVFVAGAGALVVFAAYVLRLRCEGFGCTGIGIAWLAWAGVYVPVLALGGVLRGVLPPGTGLRRLVAGSLFALLALGAALLLAWGVGRAA
jgi:hypothetical protein